MGTVSDMGYLGVRTVFFVLIGYIVSHLMTEQRAQRQELDKANRRLVRYASTLEQLAISQDGTISGTFLNRAAEVTLPLLGSLDRTTQRAAWKVGEEDAIVMETQLESLTQDQSTILMYFEEGVTESWWMFRIDQETAE